MKLIKELYAYRQMIISLTHRELRGRYKGSVLGFLWTFINPLLQLIIYTIIFGVLLKSTLPNFYLYVFVGLIPWLFFQNSFTNASQCLIHQKNLVTKIYFPREVIPLSYVLTAFINMLYCFIIVAVVTLVTVFFDVSNGFVFNFPPLNAYGESYNFLTWFAFPLIIIIQFILCLGVALITSTISVYLRDFEHIMGVLSMGLTYATPIMYETSIAGSYAWIFYLNPMSSLIDAYHAIFYYGRWPNFDITSYQSIWLSFGVAIIILVIGVFVFKKGKKRFAEEL